MEYLISSLPYRRPFTYTKSQSNELLLSPSSSFSVARASSPFLTHSATAATLTTAATFSFFSSLLNTEPVAHSPCLSRSFSFAEQIKLKLLFSSSQVSSSTPAPPVAASVPTTVPLSPFISTPFWLGYLFSAAAIISSSQCFQKESKKEKILKVKVYADRMSQPSRAVLIFCKVNGIEFDEIRVEISKRQQLSPEFAAINPFKKLPAIVDGRFKLFERRVLFFLAVTLSNSDFPTQISWMEKFLRKRTEITAPVLMTPEVFASSMAYLEPHFNPNKMKHGAPGDQICHAGDLENIVANADGVAEATIVDNQIPLIGPNPVVGRALVVHELEDDLGKGGKELSLSTGNAGGRLACALLLKDEGFSISVINCISLIKSPLAVASEGRTDDAKRRGDVFARAFSAHLAWLMKEPAAHGKLGRANLLEMREECLREFQFVDAYRSIKQRENEASLAVLPDLLMEIDSMELWMRYFLAEIEGLEQKSDSEVEKGLLMLLDSDLPALKVDFLELQNSKWRAFNCVGK
ncbi:Superoxide dismutase [Cu-Zn] [Arachis hypogaea]|nr:Superoxide dismutase [Cu-Zn] [Arachis hypogaea]